MQVRHHLRNFSNNFMFEDLINVYWDKFQNLIVRISEPGFYSY
jgi:hypothetical protein